MVFFTISHASLIGVSSWIFTNLMIEDGMMLSPYNTLLKILPRWMAIMLGANAYWLAAEFAFFFYYYLFSELYNPIDHIFMVSFALFMVRIIDFIFYGENVNWKKSTFDNKSKTQKP